MQDEHHDGLMTKQHLKKHILRLLQHLMVISKAYLKEPIYFQNPSSRIDLFFNNQTNLVVHHGVHSFLNSNCHYEIIHFKLKLKFEYTRFADVYFVWKHWNQPTGVYYFPTKMYISKSLFWWQRSSLDGRGGK